MANVIDLAKYVARIDLDDKGLMEGLDKSDSTLKSKMGGLSSFLKISVAGGIAAVGAAIGGTIVSGVKATADLEQQLSQFQASTGATASEVEDIRKIAQDLYKVNTDSMEDIIATSEAMKQAMGLTTEEIGSTQQAFMDFAKTTGQNNADVVGAIDDIGDAWGLNLDEMVGSLDMFKLSSEKFGTDILGVQSAMQQAAPAAKALGLSFEETNGFLNAMAESGLDANSAVTAFTYAAKTVESPEAFRQMLADIQAIEDPTARTQKAVELFGARAGVAMSNVLDGTKNLDDFIVTMQEAEGTVSSASEAFDSNFNVQLDLAKKMFSGLVQELGEKFMPILNEVLTWVTGQLPTIVGYIESSIDFIGSILSPFIELIRNIITVFTEMETSTDSSFSGIKDVIGSVIESIQSFIQSFVDFAKWIWQNWGEEITAFTQKYMAAVKENIESFLNIIKGIFDFFTALFKGDWEGMGKALADITTNFFELIKNIWNMSIEAIKLIFTIAIDVLKDIAIKIMTGIWDSFKNVWNSITTWFSDVFSALFDWFRGLRETFFNIGESLFRWMWDGLKSIWSGITDWVSDTIDWLKDKLMFWRKSQSEMSSSGTTVVTGGYSIPSYDIGTPFVPSDQLAFVHRGEAIIPAKYNPNNPENSSKSTIPVTQTTENHFHIGKLELPNVTNNNGVENLVNGLSTYAIQWSHKLGR